MKITVKNIIECFEKKIPTHLAEKWDNVGLQLGSKNWEITGILTTLDVTKEAVDLAIRRNCNLIVSHHPFFFKGIKQINVDSYQGAMISKLIRHKIAVYSAHTNLDIAIGGLNDMAVKRLGLTHVRGLYKTSDDELVKVVTFVPSEAAEGVRLAMAEAGAGFIGAYSHCSYSTLGCGRFKPLKGTNPYVGTLNKIEKVEEERVETICRKEDISKILRAMIDTHPYEEVAYDVYPLLMPKGAHYLGRIGELPSPLSIIDFAQLVERAFPKSPIRFAGARKSQIKTVALCTGSGADFIGEAFKGGADAYITGDVKYHDGQKALELGILVADAGHFGTEEYVAKGLKELLVDLLPPESVDTIKWEVFSDQEDFFFYI